MLSENILPAADELGVFLRMLELLRDHRLAAKEKMQAARPGEARNHYDALQRTFKILINSFYGYLGFAQGRFSDFGAAERVTAGGRKLLKLMISVLRELGAEPVEIDTDGIYFVPPTTKTKRDLERFRVEFRKSLPPGIEIEFDGEYDAMYSYKMKNYALLCSNGEVVIKGAALKSRGLEPFQRSFLRRLLRLKLEGHEDRIPALKKEYETGLEKQEWDVTEFGKTVTLQDAPQTYAGKIAQKARGRDAAYELALKSDREYRAGDQLTYYVTGTAKSVAAHANARLISEWDPANRDENVSYYQAKLDALYRKFYVESDSGDLQQKLGLTDKEEE
jgi:DNA polymerase elongation subunit (family B)